MDLLANVFWHALRGPQADLSAGTDTARRYARGFTPLLGFATPQQPDFAALSPCCEPGEQFYCADWTGPAPAGWRVDVDATMYRMVWQGPVPGTDEAPEAVPLGPQHLEQVLELAALTRPGPFGARTIEMGEYFGLFEGPQLVAMTGERAHASSLREVSGVCTRPSHQGQGLARKLVAKVVRRQAARGETSFLHVMSGNTGAVALYRRMGFGIYQEGAVRLVTRL